MRREIRSAPARTALALLLAMGAAAAGGCSSLLGVDDGIPFSADGSSDDATARDQFVGSDGTADVSVDTAPGDDARQAGDTAGQGDVSSIDGTSVADAPDDGAETSLPEGCAPPECGQNRCGSVRSACGSTSCGSCPSGKSCVVSGGVQACCTQATCGNRCNTSIPDDCGGTIACPGTGCSSGQVCDLSTTTCCSPSPACNNRCNLTAPDGCGYTVQCMCQPGAICTSNNVCCVPNGICSGSCVDNCGQYDPQCCDSGMPDGMPPACTPRSYACGSTFPPCCPGTSCVAQAIVPMEGGTLPPICQ